MIDLKLLSPIEREALAQSRFGILRPKDIPSNWRELIERDLIERKVIATEDELALDEEL
jgi:hypothetical protein